uniref:Uncharacterized protein n=1 Tax=Arundo donax TaxID=35708 RepID=A0A0A9EV63_ARUDO
MKLIGELYVFSFHPCICNTNDKCSLQFMSSTCQCCSFLSFGHPNDKYSMYT